MSLILKNHLLSATMGTAIKIIQLLIKAAALPYETSLMHFPAESFVQGIFGVY